MIYITRIQSALEPLARTFTQTEYRPGLKVSDIVHTPWPEGRVVLVNNVESDPDTILSDGDRLRTFDRPTDPAFTPYLIAFVVTSLLSLAVSTFVKPPRKRGEASSPSHSWTGISSARGEGNPVPKSYGRTRSGGQVIGEFTRQKGKSGSYVWRLIEFGYGPFGSIAGIEADTQQDQPRRSMHDGDLGIPTGVWMGDKPLDVFRSSELHVRLGTPTQLPIEGWDRTTQTIKVGQDMKRPPANSTSTFEQYISASPSPTDDPLVAEYGIPVDLSREDIDSFTVQVRFPSGLYSLGSLGEVLPWYAQIYVEIQEKDSNGNLVTTGGPHADGILRFRPTPLLFIGVQGDVGFDWEFPCYDIQSYTQPALGHLGSFQFENTSFAEAWMQNTSPTVPAAWNDGDPMDAFSVGAWIVLRPNGASTGATSNVTDASNVVDNPIFVWHDAATDRGFQLVLGTRTFTLSGGGGAQSPTRIVPIAFLGDGTETKEFYERNADGAHASTTASSIGDVDFRCTVHGTNDTPLVDYARVWITYKAGAVNGLDRLRIYAQGELVLEVIDTIGLLCTSADFLLGRDAASDATNKRYFKGHLDEVVLENREITSVEAERDYATGRGKAWTSTATTVALYRFDASAVQGDGTTSADSSSNANTLTLKLSPNTTPSNIRSGSLASIIEVAGSNTVHKGKYVARVVASLRDVVNGNRIDDMRLEAVQTHIAEEFNFAGSPVLAVKVRADEEGAGIPQDTSAIHESIKCRVYSGTETPTPTFVEVASRNPAWQCLTEVQSRLHGLGQYVEVDAQTIRDAALWAARCDELIYDLRGRTTFDDADTATPIFDLTYDSTLFSGFGGIVISFRTSPVVYRPPAHWKVGSFLAFRDLPTTGGGIAFGINVNEGFDGFEIGTVAWNGGNWEVTIKFDSATHGNPWTDGQQYAITYGSPVTATIEGREERYVFDETFDEQRQAWDDLQRHCEVGHGRARLDGNAIRFSFDGPVAEAEVVDLVGMGNIVRNSFTWKKSSPTQEPNAFDATFRDERKDFDQALASGEDPDLQGTTTLDKIRREPIELFGVCRSSQATREVYQRIARNKLVTERGSMRVGPDGLEWVPGKVVQLAHDMLTPSGYSGRVLDVDADDSVKLDRAVVLEAATTYTLAIRNSARLNGETFETRTVTSSAGSYAIGDALTVSVAFSFTPNVGDVWHLYEAGTEYRVRVGDISLSEKLERNVALEVYVAAVHDDDANIPDISLSNA